MSDSNKISACLVVFNEENLIERCLKSIAPLVDEIIIVHDGPCTDRTLEIAANYTDKIFIQPHIGIAEPHRSFSFAQANGPWILQIDADEYVDTEAHQTIKKLLQENSAEAYYFQWELWDGVQAISFKGLQKLVLFKKSAITFQGLPQKEVSVNGRKEKVSLTMHHRPRNENVSWKSANEKRRYWLQAHVPYYLPELVTYECFQTTSDSWVAYVRRVRQHPWLFIAWYPLKNFLGQLKNGLWTSRVGISLALQQYVYYVILYWKVMKKAKELRFKN